MSDAVRYAFNVWQAIKVIPADCYVPICRVMSSRAGDRVRRLLKPAGEALETASRERRVQGRPSASSRSAFRVFALVLALFACEVLGSEARARDACPGSLPELYKKVSPAAVSITAAPVNPWVGEPIGRVVGSGFLFDTSGLVLTNAHLVFGQATISVTLNDGQVVPAQLVGADPVLDVAVVRLSRSTGERFPVMELGDSNHALVGEEVLAIGNPLGLQQSLTRGIISAVNRTLPHVPFALTEPMIQTDAPINPGNSGGPLVNVCGQVLGITRGILPNAQNIGFAIPINVAKELIPKLLADGRVIRPWLGIEGQLVSEPVKALLRAPLVDGLMVEVVAPGSPAERAGLRAGQLGLVIDGNPFLLGGDIITAINNGVAIKTPDQLSRALKDLRVGDTVHLTVARANEPFYVESVLGERPLLPDDVAAPKGATLTASEVGRPDKTWTSPIRLGL